MERFPTEILLNIFQHLPTIYSQHQCLQVCRSWNAVAHTFTTDTTHKVVLYGYGGIRRLPRAVAADPVQGLAIRQMYFIMQTSTGDPITQYEFIALMNGCPRLAEIVFVDVNPFYYIRYLCRHNVQLPQLEQICLGSRSPDYMVGHDYVNLAYKYRATLHQLCIHVPASSINSLGLSSITNYLRRFLCLKHLSLNTSCPIVFDALIRACPQLQVLDLKMRSRNSFKVMGDERNDTTLDLNPASQLETLKLNSALMSLQLYQYFKHCCPCLSHLTITLNSDADFDPLTRTFDTFRDAQSLAIIDISFDNYSSEANILMQNLSRWFPRLIQVEIKGFDLASVTSNHYNLSLDFRQLNLVYLSIDISHFFDTRKSPLARIALELVTDSGTIWYQREGKRKTGKQFVLKDNPHYTNDTSKEKRMRSDKTAVITIKASDIQTICLLFTSHHSSFDQIIRLSQ
ncbi:unnamed protein product [Mucor fragilis]